VRCSFPLILRSCRNRIAIGEWGVTSLDIATTFQGRLIPGRSKRDNQKRGSTTIPRVVGLEKKATNCVTDHYLECPAALAAYLNQPLHSSPRSGACDMKTFIAQVEFGRSSMKSLRFPFSAIRRIWLTHMYLQLLAFPKRNLHLASRIGIDDNCLPQWHYSLPSSYLPSFHLP
jgi:hypothetical protein